MFAVITAGADQRRDRGPAEVHRLVVFVGALGDRRLLPGRALGVRFDGVGRRLAGSPTSCSVIDFAGGTAVHINAGAAGLALAWCSASASAVQKDPMRPHNLPLVMLGAGLLWFGWFGFNAGSALAANGVAGDGLHEHPGRHRRRDARLAGRREDPRRQPSPSLGAASGAVAGLVAITPACGVGHRRSARSRSA